MMSKADAPLGNNAVAQSYRAALARLVRGEGRHPEHAGQVVRITPASVAREAGRSRNPLYTTHKAILEEIEVASGGATPASDLAAKVLHLEADLARLRAEVRAHAAEKRDLASENLTLLNRARNADARLSACLRQAARPPVRSD